MAGKKEKRGPVKAGFLTKVVILALLAVIGWQLYGLQDQLAAAERERDSYAEQVAQRQRENAALQADIDEGPTDEKLQEIARDELGLVKPGEYVFRTEGSTEPVRD